jgi:multidrug efflux system membrane fusion protein
VKRPVLVTILGIAALGAVGWFIFHSPAAETSSTKSATATSPAAPITTAVAKTESFAVRRRTIGILESPAIVVVKSRIQSQVTQQHVFDGQLVKKGDLLFTLDDREVKAAIARSEAQLAKDQATADKTKTDLDHYGQLSSTNAVPRQQLDQATADHKIALATVESDKAQLRADNLQLDYITIEAPIGGRLGSVRITPGNLVSVNDDVGLVTITQIRPIRANFTLAERDLSSLRKAYITKPPAAVRVYTAGTREALATGELDFVDSAVDTASGTIAAKAKFANENFQLWPGSYVDVEIDLSVRPNTVMIPTVAIQSGQSGPFVFVAKDGQKAEMRKVELIGSDGERTALASGVNDGERVIVEGQMRLVDGARVSEAKTAAGDNKSPAAGDNKAGASSAPAPAGATQ